EGACEDRRRGLWQRLQAHVQQHPQHRATIEAARAKDPAQGAAFADRYADELALRAIDEPGGSVSESALVRASLGEYSAMDPTQSTGAIPSWAKATLGVAGYFFGDEMANVALTGLAELHQDYVDRWTAKQRYYVIAAYGPHIYGILVMILLGLFPIAGLFALCPGQWKVFLNYSRFFLSLKFWPVGWSLLSSFNQRRGILEAFESPERVNGTPFLVIATMYLLVPGIAFAIVHLATTAASLPFAQASPSAAGPGAGPVAPAVHVAARLAK
ncbi:MAG: hypothetical protein HY293_12450, partial [Planctomycetes bacterium]|nr:hypothetical protein [Planctomycetota bacterium]